MKVLIINYEFPPLGGGAGNASYYLAKHLSKMGHEITVLTSAFRGLPMEELLDGFRILRIPVIRKRVDRCSIFEMITFIVSGIFHSNAVIDRYKPEKIIAFFGIPSGIIAYWIKKMYSLPYIISLRGGDVPGFFTEKLKYYHYLLKPIIKHIWGKAAHVISNSDRLYSLAKQTTPDLEILIIPNGVDCERYKPLDEEGYKNSRICILAVGRLAEQKGINSLLEACHLLNKTGYKDKYRLVIVGDGPARRKLEQQANKLCLHEQISFSGWITKDEMPDKYNTVDIFVSPSLDEGMSNALLEAMATGLPIVASNFAGDNLLVNTENALVVPVNNKQLLSEALKQLIINKDLRKTMGKNSLLIARNLSWSETARAYDSICQATLNKAIRINLKNDIKTETKVII